MKTFPTLRRVMLGLAGMALMTAGCGGGGEEDGGQSGAPEPASLMPQDARSSPLSGAPTRSTDAEDAWDEHTTGLDDILEHTSAIIEGDVKLLSHEYSEVEGPRTVYQVSGVSVHLSSPHAKIDSTFLLRVFGGPLPGGRSVAATHLAPLVDGKRHVLFLERDRWWASPVIYRYSFTVEDIGDRQVLVDHHGRLVTGISGGGAEAGPRVLSPNDELRPERGTFVDPSADDGSGLTVDDFVQRIREHAERNAISMSGVFSKSPAVFAASWSMIPAATQDGPAVSAEEATAATRRLECLRDVQRALKAHGIRDSRPADFEECQITSRKGE